jgi:hypothetical protein
MPDMWFFVDFACTLQPKWYSMQGKVPAQLTKAARCAETQQAEAEKAVRAALLLDSQWLRFCKEPMALLIRLVLADALDSNEIFVGSEILAHCPILDAQLRDCCTEFLRCAHRSCRYSQV